MSLSIEHIYFFVLANAVIMPLLIFTMLRFYKKKSGLRRDLAVDTGNLICESGWGDAKINGVHLKNCVKLSVFENGYQVRVLPIFFFGKLWLPKPTTKIGETYRKNIFFPVVRDLSSEDDHVMLIGKLANTINADLR